VRARSIEVIMQSADMSLHLELCESAADLIYHFIHCDAHRDEDDLAIRLLGIRMFNGLNATLKLLLSGYYQASTLQHRDLLETVFLLDFLQGDRSLIARWRRADEKELRAVFGPVEVRKALDARDGFTGKKRAAAYKIFSTLAGHPNPQGFRMLRLQTGDHHCGPFLEATALQATVSELGKTAVQVGGTFAMFFAPTTKQDYRVKLTFLECQHRWIKRFFEKEPIDLKQIEEMHAMVACLPD
jgi:hypothetical protein